MDVICPRCGEPLDLMELHEMDVPFNEAKKTFFDLEKGCGILFDGKPCEENFSSKAQASALLYEILGDDIDGIAAETEDLEYFGLLD